MVGDSTGRSQHRRCTCSMAKEILVSGTLSPLTLHCACTNIHLQYLDYGIASGPRSWARAPVCQALYRHGVKASPQTLAIKSTRHTKGGRGNDLPQIRRQASCRDGDRPLAPESPVSALTTRQDCFSLGSDSVEPSTKCNIAGSIVTPELHRMSTSALLQDRRSPCACCPKTH